MKYSIEAYLYPDYEDSWICDNSREFRFRIDSETRFALQKIYIEDIEKYYYACEKICNLSNKNRFLNKYKISIDAILKKPLVIKLQCPCKQTICIKPWEYEQIKTDKDCEEIIRQHLIFPEIDNVVFNPPSTTVFWKDGTKTTVKCISDDIFDEEKGLLMAICKKVYGDGYYTLFNKYAKKDSNSICSRESILKQISDKWDMDIESVEFIFMNWTDSELNRMQKIYLKKED